MTDRLPFALPGARPQYGPDRVVRVEHIDARACGRTSRTKTLARRGHARACARSRRRAALAARRGRSDDRAVRDARGAALAFDATASDLTVDLPARARRPAKRSSSWSRTARSSRGAGCTSSTGRGKRGRRARTPTRARWVPCFDHPAEKQTTTTTIVVERGHVRARQRRAGRTRRATRRRRPSATSRRIPHATYLLTLVAGEFSEIEQPHAARCRSCYYVAPGREADGERSFGNTPQMIDAFEAALGVPYPYARYSQIVVADFIFGGMENTTRHDADRPHAARRARAPRLLERSAGRARAGAPVVRRPADLPRLVAGLAQRGLRHLLRVRLDGSAAAAGTSTSATVFEIVGAVPRRGRGALSPADRLQRLPRADRPLRPPPLRKGRRGAAHAARRAGLGADEARRCAATSNDNATGSVETIDLVRAIEARDRPQPARVLRAVDRSRGGHPELEVRAEPGTTSARC